MSPAVQVSWGELFDKIAILEIKSDRLASPAARANVAAELAHLNAAVAGLANPPDALADLGTRLKAVNTRLWDIEDAIRAMEERREFGPEFVALARAVYLQNDERARIKREISVLLNSELIEEKQYSPY